MTTSNACSSRASRRFVTLVAVLAIAGTASACGSTAPKAVVPVLTTPSTASPATSAAAARSTTPIVATVAVATTVAPIPTTAGSGDPALDALDSDLSALENEDAGLNSASQAASK